MRKSLRGFVILGGYGPFFHIWSDRNSSKNFKIFEWFLNNFWVVMFDFCRRCYVFFVWILFHNVTRKMFPFDTRNTVLAFQRINMISVFIIFPFEIFCLIETFKIIKMLYELWAKTFFGSCSPIAFVLATLLYDFMQ